MEDFKSLVQNRRSYRAFLEEEIDSEKVKLIIRAALMSPTSKGGRAWQFIVVDDKEKIEKLSEAKEQGAKFLKSSPLAIVVLGDKNVDDCWIEDGSIAAISMQYQAEDLGLGSCWVQMRGRGLSDGTSSDEIIRGILGIPDNLFVLCVIAVGNIEEKRRPQNEEALKWENVHVNEF